MKWNNLKAIKPAFIICILISIPITIFALVYFLRLGDYSSDSHAFGKGS
jgi:hypothetical protein